MNILEGANLALRFLLELGAVLILAYWGWRVGSGAWSSVLAIAAPLALVVVWVLFVSPNPTVELARSAQFAIEVGVWTAAAAALRTTGHTRLAAGFLVVALVSGTLNYLWD